MRFRRPSFDFLEDRITPAGPAVVSIALVGPSPTNASSVGYQVTFNEPVTGVDAGDFALAETGTISAVIGTVSGSGATYAVTVNSVVGNGTLGLNLVPNGTIKDGSNSVLTGGTFVGSIYAVEHTYPVVQSIVQSTPATSPTNSGSIAYTVTFSEPVTGVDATDFQIASTGTVTGVVSQVVGSGAGYTVTVGSIVGDGTVQLKLVDNGTIRDLASNPLADSGFPLAYQQPPITYHGYQGASTAIADFNGDGKPDIAIADGVGQYVNVRTFLGNGDGTFKIGPATSANYGVGTVFAADVNGDGKADLVMWGSNQNQGAFLCVLLGNGNGTFQQQKSFSLDGGTREVALADVNGDGKPDVVAVSYASDIWVLLGNGDGTFKAPMTSASLTDTSVAVADVNNDKIPDLIVSNPYNDAVSLYLGNGNGTFKAPTTFSSSPIGDFVAADLNNDGNVDFTALSGTTAFVYFGNGNGTFKAPKTYSVPDSPSSTALVDVNGDGKLDLITGGNRRSTVGIFLGNGNGTFGPETTFAVHDLVVGSAALAVADLNGDGRPDIVTQTGYYPPSFSVLLNTDNGNFAGPTTTIDQTPPTATISSEPPLESNSSSATFVYSAADPTAGGVSSGIASLLVSLDGAPFAAVPSPGVYNRLSQGSHTFTARATDNAGNITTTSYVWTVDTVPPQVQSITQLSPSASATNASSVTYSVAFSEPVTGVGLSDFSLVAAGAVSGTISQVTGSGASYVVTVAGINGDGTIAIQLNDNGAIEDLAGNHLSAANFSITYASHTQAAGVQPDAVTAGDFTGDGVPDLVVASVNNDTVGILIGNGDGTFKPFASMHSGFGSDAVAVGDLNGDGKLDFAVSNSFDNTDDVFLGNGDGTFKTPLVLPTGPGASSIVIADFNGDGKLDLAELDGGGISIFLGNGNGTFRARQTISTPTTPFSLAAADLNGDGHVDLLVANLSVGNIGILFGNGDGSFKSETTLAAGATPYQAAAVDINGDGKVDLVVSDYRTRSNVGTDALVVLLGNGDGTFKTPVSSADGVRPHQFELGDFNGDSKLDAAVTQNANAGAPIALVLGNGDGTFGPPQFLGTGTGFQGGVAADFNRDGLSDLAITAEVANAIAIVIPSASLLGPTTTIDQTAPVVTLASAPPPQSDNATARFVFFALDPVSGGVSSGVVRIEVSLDGSPFTTASSPAVLAGLTTGSHTFQARAFDVAGNVSTVDTYVWNVNLSATTETIDVDSVAIQPSADLAVDNDFTRFVNAFANVQPGDTVVIHGILDWSEPNALASWAAANYAHALPHVDDITVEAASPGNGITGPSDLRTDTSGADLSGEGPFYFDGQGTDRGWNITGLTVSNFDTAFFYSPETDAQGYAGTHLIDNTINVPSDNADAGENGGILLGPGANQVIQGNQIYLAGDGGAANGSFGISSFTFGGDAWNNLLVDNNTITVTTPGANEKILGIGENSGAVGSNITVSNNSFIGTDGEDSANQQIAFGITSESVVATANNPAATVVYTGNTVSGANEGFVWGDPEANSAYDFTGSQNLGITFSNTTLTNVNVGFVDRDGGKATIGSTTITNSGMFNFGTAFHADGQGSVLTVIDPISNYTGVQSLADETNGGLVIFLMNSAVIPNVSKNEGNNGNTLFSFPVTLSAPLASDQSFTVQYSTSNGSATGNDYQSAAGTLTFLPGQQMAMITVKVFGNVTPQPNRTFFVNLTDPLLITNGVSAPGNLSTTQVTGTIVDDDQPILTASITSSSVVRPTSGTTTMAFMTSIAGWPVPIPAGDTYATVNYATSSAGSGPGIAGSSDYQSIQGTLTFLAGSTTPVNPLTVLVVGSSQANLDEIFNVTLSTPLLHYSFTNQTTPESLGTSAAVGTIHPAAAQQTGVTVTVNSQSVTPSSSAFVNMTFTVALSQPLTGAIKVNWATSSAGSGAGDATGNQYQGNSGTVTFTPGATTETFSVIIYPESKPLPQSEIFDVILSIPTGQSLYTLGNPSIGVGTIDD